MRWQYFKKFLVIYGGLWLGLLSCDSSNPIEKKSSSSTSTAENLANAQVKVLDFVKELLKLEELKVSRSKADRAVTTIKKATVSLMNTYQTKYPYIEWEHNDFVDYYRVMRCAKCYEKEPKQSVKKTSLSKFQAEIDAKITAKTTVKSTACNKPRLLESTSVDDLINGAGTGNDVNKQVWKDVTYDEISSNPAEFGFLECTEIINDYEKVGIEDTSADAGRYTYFVVGCLSVSDDCGMFSAFENFTYPDFSRVVPTFFYQERDRIYNKIKEQAGIIVEEDKLARKEADICEEKSDKAFEGQMKAQKLGMYAMLGVGIVSQVLMGYGVSPVTGENCYKASEGESTSQKNERRKECQQKNLEGLVKGQCDSQTTQVGKAKCQYDKIKSLKSTISGSANPYALAAGVIGLGINSLPLESSKLGGLGGVQGIAYAVTNLSIDEADLEMMREHCPQAEIHASNVTKAIDMAEMISFDLAMIVQKIDKINNVGDNWNPNETGEIAYETALNMDIMKILYVQDKCKSLNQCVVYTDVAGVQELECGDCPVKGADDDKWK